MSSFTWTIIVGMLLIGLVVVAAGATQRGASRIGFPYKLGRPLLSAAERSFLGVLDQAVGPEYRVFAKVRIADVAAVKPGMTRGARQGALNRIASKHFDFVICRASDLAIVCAVELDDASHGTPRAKTRDQFVAEVCRTIGLPLLSVAASATYVLHEVRSRFQEALRPPASPS